MMMKIDKKLKSSNNWYSLFAISILIAFFFVFMEWLFFVTKPSFMDGMGIYQKVGIFLVAGGILAIILLALILVFFTVYLISPNSSSVYLLGASLVPAILLAILALLLLDNFTYTIFKFGIVSTHGIFRVVYAFLFLILLFFSYKWMIDFEERKKSTSYRRFLYILPLVLILAGAVFMFGRTLSTSSEEKTKLETGAKKFPNILILGSDGISASHTSLYGYDRDTTPYLRQLASRSLVAENAFPNAGNSSGSVTSMLTGKLPTRTRVLYSPNALNGLDAYQHLPGILNELGYFTVEIGLPKYVDAYEVNMRDGFDVVNQHFISNDSFFQAIPALRLGDVSYFLYLIFERVADRLLHIFYIRTMENPYKLVTQPDTQLNIGDRQRINQLLELIDTTDEPLFVHMHLMGTHGPMFYPSHQTYSAGEKQEAEWQDDFYDDAILDFDAYIKEVFGALSASGKLDNTVVVIYTDHNQRYHTTQRIPLLFYFPGEEHAGQMHNNVQNADISPTLLDYLKVPIPEWMEGQSLLKGEPPRNRLIFSATAGQVDPEKYSPPFYQFGTIGVVACDRWYEFYTKSNLLVTGQVNGHTSPCSQRDEITLETLKTGLLNHLQESNFKVDTLPVDIYETSPYGRLTRAQASLFILRTMHGTSYHPPPATGLFTDVASSNPVAAWIEQTYREGLIDSCSDTQIKFCPEDDFTLADAAKLILQVKNGDKYRPPSSTIRSPENTCSSPASAWVEQLQNQGFLAGCTTAPLNCCPKTSVDIRQLSGLLPYALKKP